MAKAIFVKVKALKTFMHTSVRFEAHKFYEVPEFLAAKFRENKWVAVDGDLGISFADEKAVSLKERLKEFIDHEENKRFKGTPVTRTPVPVAKHLN